MGEPRQLLGILFLIGGVGFMAYVWLRQKSVEASKSWPSVSGKITRSEVVRESSMRQGSANTFYVAKIEYTYVVDGEIHSDDTICIGGELNTSMRGRADARVQKYPKDSFVQVFYNPKDPKQACLEQRGEIRAFGYLIGGVFAVVGILMLQGMLFS